MDVVVREVVVEGGRQLEVEAPDAVIERHAGVQGQRKGMLLFHPSILPVLRISPGRFRRGLRRAGNESGRHAREEL